MPSAHRSGASRPPPLSPPHEGEGDAITSASVLVSLPLAGRGQGWGSTIAGVNCPHLNDNTKDLN